MRRGNRAARPANAESHTDDWLWLLRGDLVRLGRNTILPLQDSSSSHLTVAGGTL